MSHQPPRGRFFEDFSIGEEFLSERYVVTARDIQLFAELTGDHNPLHVDADFAAMSTPYGKVVAHGLYGLSLTVGLLERRELFHGTAIAFLGIEDWTFRAPIFVGDEIYSRMAISEARRSSSDPSRGIINRELSLHNSDGHYLQGGLASILVRCRTADAR